MRFGNMFRRATHFLTDTLGKALSHGGAVRGIAKGLDQLGVGGGRLGGFVDKGLGLAEKAHRSLTEFGEMTPAGQSKRLGDLAGRGLSSLFGQAASRLGGGPEAMRVGRGLGQLGGNFMSQGLQRLLG